MNLHRTFISFFHENLFYKEKLVNINELNNNSIFIDGSVDTRDIDDNLSDGEKRLIIRDEYLKDTSVTIVLVGQYTKNRKHVDWEIGSSIIDGKNNKRSGIVIIELPEISKGNCVALNQNIKREVEKIKNSNWVAWDKSKIFSEHKYIPFRINKSIKDSDVEVNILAWNDIIKNPNILKYAIDDAYQNKDRQKWNTSIPFRKSNNDSFIYENENYQYSFE